MTSVRFFFISLVILGMFYFFNKKKIRENLKCLSIYYYCWIFMLVSNLGFSPHIQYLTRAIGIVFTWLCIFITERGHIKLLKNNVVILIFIYLLVCLLSTVYSISRFQTFIKCIELLTDFILIWLIYTKDTEKFITRTLDITVIICFMLNLITLIGFILYPVFFADTGISAKKSILGIRLGGGLLGANKASALAAICIVWLLLLNNKRDLFKILMFLVSVFVMFFSQSRSTLVVIPIILILKLYKPKEKNKWLYILVILIGVSVAVMNKSLIQKYLLRGQNSNQLMSGTGRFHIWNSAKELINEKPILGYGFGAGGELVAKSMYGIATMHSAIYETLLGTGFVGLTFLIIQFLYVTFVIIRNFLKYGLKNNMADIIFLGLFMIRSITSVGIGNWHSQEIMIWYFFIFALSTGATLQTTYMKNTEEEMKKI